jgi:hypothetical protein
MSFGVIPADSMASLAALSAISMMLSLSLPYFVLPAPRTQTLLLVIS